MAERNARENHEEYEGIEKDRKDRKWGYIENWEENLSVTLQNYLNRYPFWQTEVCQTDIL